MLAGRVSVAVAGLVALGVGCNGPSTGPNGSAYLSYLNGAPASAVAGGGTTNPGSTTGGGTTGGGTTGGGTTGGGTTGGGTTGGGTTGGGTTSGTAMWLYVANQGSNNITTFKIDGTSGVASGPNDTAMPTGFQPFWLCTDPTGFTLFATGIASNQVLGIAIQGGKLTLGTPVATSASAPAPVAVTADSSAIYVADANISASGTPGTNGVVEAFPYSTSTISPSTALTVGTAGGPTACVVDAAGTFLYVAMGADNQIVSIPVTNGVMGTPNQGVTCAGASSQAGPISIAIDPAGANVFAGNTDGTITPFAVSNGALTAGAAVKASSSTTAAVPLGLAVDSTGTFLASANGGAVSQITGSAGSDDVSVFSINAGAISMIGNSWGKAGTAPGACIFHPTVAVLYCSNQGNNTIGCFNVASSIGLTPLSGAGTVALPANDTVPSGLAVAK
jgi:6-phosphogluconolactonase (cycloisomerase 2 family)